MKGKALENRIERYKSWIRGLSTYELVVEWEHVRKEINFNCYQQNKKYLENKEVK